MKKETSTIHVSNGLEEAMRSALLADHEQHSIRKWLTEQLTAQEYAKLSQGGHTNDQIPLRRVFVDLPVSDSPRSANKTGSRVPFLSKLLNAPPILLSDALSFHFEADRDSRKLENEDRLSHLALLRLRKVPKPIKSFAATLLVGGPGQGKSTLGQLACQLHRAALLKPYESRLTSAARELVRSFEGSIEENTPAKRSLNFPKQKLLPIQVSLPELAVWLARTEASIKENEFPSMLRFLADLPSSRACELSVNVLARLAVVMPTLIVLDGFDEVGAGSDREQLVRSANELLQYLASNGARAQIIATTRPQGYTGEFSKLGVSLRPRYLVPLSKSEALEYARKLVFEKIPGMDERSQTFARLQDAATEPATERLLTTPLQVTILAALVQQRGRAPRERWNLFFGYFSYTYAREAERQTYASQLLRDYKTHIEQIHARVALLLQVESERAGGASARMPRSRLEEVIDAVLLEAGYEDPERKNLVRDIAIAAEQRLVFLVEPEPGTFGFEIRSFQEFMAAWALTTGREGQVEARLVEAARAPMFRNVTLFAASRIFSEGSHLREVFSSTILNSLNNAPGDKASSLTRAGALLALEAVEEGAVLSFPRWAKQLIQCAAHLLYLPPGQEHRRLASVGTEELRRGLQTFIEEAIIEAKPGKCVHTSSVWITLVEASNRDEKWAIETAELLWPEFEHKFALILRDCRAVDVAIGTWLKAKILEGASYLRPSDFIDMQDLSAKSKGTSDWVGLLTRVYGAENRWERQSDELDSFYLSKVSDFKSKRALFENPPPASWNAWCKAAMFEIEPTPATLSDALIALAAENEIVRSQIEWKSSWPLAACLRTSSDANTLLLMSANAIAGKLGDELIWRSAEKKWKNAEIYIDSKNFSESVPWSPESLKYMPPLAVTTWWDINGSDQSDRERLRNADEIFRTTRSSAMRQMAARAGLVFLRTLPEDESVAHYNIHGWVLEEPYFIGVLFPRPRCLNENQWLEILQDIPVPMQMSYISDFDSVLHLLRSGIAIPLALRASLCMIRFSVGRQLTPPSRQLLADAMQGLDVMYTASLDARIIRVYIGNLSIEEDLRLINDVIATVAEDEFYLAALLAALEESAFVKDRVAEYLGILYPELVDSSAAGRVLEQLRKVFQKHKSAFDVPTTWDAYGLALPHPTADPTVSLSKLIADFPIHIRQLELKDLCGLRSLVITFSRTSAEAGQWIVLLGPNGIGKTTLLRSILLALRDTSDPTIWPKSSLSLNWLRVAEPASEAPAEAYVSVTLQNSEVYKTTIRSSTSNRFNRSGSNRFPAGIPIFAYGCRRGSALGGMLRRVDLTTHDGPEIASLFDETADLIHAETWLLQLEGDCEKSDVSKVVFDAVMKAMISLLDLENIFVRDKAVWVKEWSRPPLAFASLSDGYLTNAGWLIDLIARWIELATKDGYLLESGFLGQMTGLVIIDEIDLHLHPRWQVEIISKTRALMPKMSFIVTTHNPLTLVGAKAEEVWILSRQDGEVVVEPGLEMPMLLTGGQIYSRYFGITDLYPNAAGEKLQRYSFLSRFAMRSNSEERELISLADELKDLGIVPEWPIVARIMGEVSDSN